MTAHHYSLNLDTVGRLAGIPDDPEPPLDLDFRPIPGECLEAWRRRQVSDTGVTDYPSQAEMAEICGVDRGTWRHWEETQPPRFWSALLREWIRARRSFEIACRRATAEEVAALLVLFEDYHELAEALGVCVGTVHGWLGRRSGRDGGAPVHGGAGPLVIWLCQDLGLQPRPVDWSEVGRHVRISADDVREIRLRAEAGETNTSIANDFPIGRHAVGLIVRRVTWSELDEEDSRE